MPRVGLNPEILVAEAARLVDEIGPERLTLSALAERVGVAQPTIYKHIDRIEGMHRLLALSVLRELGADVRRAATGKAGPAALRAFATAYRDYARAHPGRYSYVVRPIPDDEVQHAISEILSVLYAVLDGYGITGDDAVDAARLIRSTMHGFVHLESNDGFQIPQSIDQSYARLVDSLDTALAAWRSPRSPSR
ncbi:TetR/AcrR family transcriptional regulator [Antrihabitans sp. YC2-6]|uniref:TetR/AcrR family transcriptional regulator n=1 Tax=Antrihabitans sp. YC2-6 TaxID=2799498 RepID=UPI0018F4FFC8|nr:TetR/AcrR family transcriptional regulator [Antrihabitans sp. YC2-6]MBJ8344377.1 WHG domain-containing protein [Antrihabitans sp. YC2-6]